MTARNYDVVLTVNDASGFEAGNVLFGRTSEASGLIANVDITAKTLKVKLNNVLQEFSSSEVVQSNTINISGSASGLLTAIPFNANTMSGNTTTASATVSAISPSAFIAEKNAFTQNPVVRLYEIYYPGEFYPPNAADNPTEGGFGRSWPTNFPIRFADIRGDLISDLQYNVTYGGTSYIPFPVNISSLDQGSDGKINELTLSVFNVDNIISALIEDPFISGNNSTNSVVGIVNGEYVHGLDPRTIIQSPSDLPTSVTVGDQTGVNARSLLQAQRDLGLAYNVNTVGVYGKSNASFTRSETLSIAGTWVEEKLDSRDLLGAAVRVKTTFANFLDVWPEHSTVKFVSSNVIEVTNTLPYRVGDVVKSSAGATTGTILEIEENRFLVLNNALDEGTATGNSIFIVNSDADAESYLEDTFKIDQLESLNDSVASFGLVSWLQYFKTAVPKRKYYKNTCQWTYRGDECQYPGPNGGAIPGTSPTLNANTNPIAADNSVASSEAGDVCGKSLLSCQLRNNQIHFGGFPATGRTVPKQ